MKNNRMEPFPHSGIVLVDKPKDWTSHDVVNFIRGRFNVKKVGHCGTLDPAATGLLVIVLGHATKMSQQLSGSDKTYEATILFGKETDSQDMDGDVTSEKDCSFLTEDMIRAEFAKFAGEMEQIPPMVSAQKIDGKRLYELAREGKEVEREAKKITIHNMEIKKIYLPYTDFVLKCSKGTYVRTICYDIGRNLGCGAVLYNLRRTASGEFSIEKAVNVEDMRSWTQEDLYRAIVEF
jgi:tRNA pseudouridine55 synthase